MPEYALSIGTSRSRKFVSIPEGWLEIDKHYSLELCFSIEKTT